MKIHKKTILTIFFYLGFSETEQLSLSFSLTATIEKERKGEKYIFLTSLVSHKKTKTT
jgi:hypothetical protein